MSDYDYDDRRSSRRHGGRTRAPEYIETEETYIAKGSGTRDLVLRQRDNRGSRDDYDQGYYDRRARSSGHGRRDRDYDDDYYSDYDDRSRRGRRSRYDDDYSRYSEDDDRPRKRSKSRVRELIEGAGLSGVVAAVTGGRSKSRRRRGSGGSDRSEYSRRRSSSRHGDNMKKWQQAASAAVITGVIEAVRSRKQAGPWTGEKGQRVATAALSAAGIDGFLDRDPHEKSKRHIVESVVGGLVASRVANGSRSKSRSGDSRGRSRDRSQSVIGRLRSRSRSIFGGRSASRGSDDRGRARSKSRGIKELAAVGGVAAIGKAIYDRVRSKSRGRLNRSRSRSVDSEDSWRRGSTRP